MKIGENLNLKKVSSGEVYLNRLLGVSHAMIKEEKTVIDSNLTFYIHDKKENWRVVGNANVDFFYKDKKTMSHGKLPGKSVVVGWIKIDDTYQGRNLGKKLLAYIEESGKKRGMEKVYATSVRASARGFWEKMGYKWSGELRTWMKEL